MRHVYRIGLAAALLVGCTLLLRTGWAQDARPAPLPPTRVAVCDVAQVVNNAEKVRAASEAMTRRLEKLRADDQKRQAKLNDLREELEEGYAPGSEAYEKVLERMEKLAVERNVWLEFEKNKAERRRATLTRQTYADIRQAAAAIARRRGLDVVLSIDRGALMGQTSPELVNDMARRNVLFAADRVDITEEVLDRLNRAAGAGAGPN